MTKHERAQYGSVDRKEACRLVDDVVARYPDQTGKLLNVLNDVQESYRHLPGEALDRIAEAMDVPVDQLVRMGDFFNHLSLDPVGVCIIDVCDGTACHTLGAARLVDEFEKKLGIKVGETTEDGLVTLRTVGCVGACGIAPVVVADGDAYGRVRVMQVSDVASAVVKKAAQAVEGEAGEGGESE